MNVLKKLGLGCGWITTEKNVNFSSEPSSSKLDKLLTASSEKLAEDSLFDIMALPNTRSQSIDKKVVYMRACCEFFELSDLLRSELHLSLISEALLVVLLIDLLLKLTIFIHGLVLILVINHFIVVLVSF